MRRILPYLAFDGNCREAMTFYQGCLGGELEVMTFGDAPMETPPGQEERVVHAALTAGPVLLMASDTLPGMEYARGDAVSVYLDCESDEEVEALFRSLSEGGRRTMPPEDAFWGARFAMCSDRFGIQWMLSHAKEAQG